MHSRQLELGRKKISVLCPIMTSLPNFNQCPVLSACCVWPVVYLSGKRYFYITSEMNHLTCTSLKKKSNREMTAGVQGNKIKTHLKRSKMNAFFKYVIISNSAFARV